MVRAHSQPRMQIVAAAHDKIGTERHWRGRCSRQQESAPPIQPEPAGGAQSRSRRSPVNVRSPGEIERALADFARKPNGGLIVTASALAASHRELIIALAARYKLPAVYYEYNFAAGGGLFSYGPISQTNTVPRQGTSTVFSKAKNLLTFRYRRQQNMSSCLTSRVRKRLA